MTQQTFGADAFKFEVPDTLEPPREATLPRI